MKKLVNLLLVAILALTIVACEAKANEKRAQADEKPANTQVSDSKKELKEISAAELLQNKNARLAISLAVEKNYITEEILGDGSKPIDFYIPVGLAFDESGKDFREKYPEGWNSYNLEKAKEYWAKAKEEL